MSVFLLDPLSDPRWSDLVSRHPAASVFHTPGWLRALRETYGYQPFALTTTPGGPLENGLVVCRVRTCLSRRLVSLPFSDHCNPLVDSPDDLPDMVAYLKQEVEKAGWRSLELRPTAMGQCVKREIPVGQGFSPASAYFLHTLDLSRPLDAIFVGFHPSHTQRAIRRAEREELTYEAGRSEEMIASFYSLLRLSRRRHGLPPQPFPWFRNLAACLGDGLTVHLASKAGVPVASILTLRFQNTLVYKYGGSDARHHHLGGMPFLFWRVIQSAKAGGAEILDLGRSDLEQPGLVAFKDHLGAQRSKLTYCVFPARKSAAHAGAVSCAARQLLVRLPDAALDLTGRLLYRHLG